MKTLALSRAAAAVLAVAAWAAPLTAPAAVLDNAGFEAGLSGWTTEAGVTLDTTDVHGGSTAARLADDAAALTATLVSALDVSTITSFGFWARSDAGVLSLVVLTYSDGSTSGTDVSLFDLGNSDWTYYDLTGALASGKSLAGFTVYGSSAAATWVDDVVLSTQAAAVPEPANGVLWLAGLGGIALARRVRAAQRPPGV